MVLLNSLRVIPPEDPLGEDAIVQPMLEVIEVFVDVFAMEPSEVFIDASLVHGGMLIEAIEDMVPNWDLDCALEEMQLAASARANSVLHSHMYCTGNIRDEFGIYLSVLDEFDFELMYMTTRHRDFVEQVDELMIDGAQFDSFDSDPSESESEEEPWESSAVDSILRNAVFEKRNEISEAKEEPMEESEPWVESMAGIIVISSDDEDEPMEESKVEVILIESSDDESMEESNAEVVQASLSHVQRNEDRQGVEPTRASGSCGGGGKPRVRRRRTCEARQGRKTCVLGWSLAAKTWQHAQRSVQGDMRSAHGRHGSAARMTDMRSARQRNAHGR
ncbi:unnamed protein product [Prunus brigantina]